MSKQRYTPTEEEQNALAREIAKEPVIEDYSDAPTMDSRYEERTLRCLISKPGGSASKGALMYRVSIPTAWAVAMGITTNDRELKCTFDGDKIIIAKSS